MLYYQSCMVCPYRARCEKVGTFDREIDEVVGALNDIELHNGYVEMKCGHLPKFCGYDISPYGLENGCVDYATLAKAVGANILANDLISNDPDSWEIFCGSPEDDEGREFFQFYLVPGRDIDLLEEAGETVFYNPEAELFLWAVDHWGTSWDYVLTSIEIEERNHGIEEDTYCL